MFTLLATLATAGEPVDQAAYKKEYGTRTPAPAQTAALNRCLAAWGDHPFGDDISSAEVRIVPAQVRVMGFGGIEPKDLLATDYPQLVLIETSVSAATRTTYELQNPNGWYCFHTATTVLGQNRINLACGAKLANSRDSGVAVLAEDETGKGDGGVVVLGEIEVNRGDCAE